MTTFKYTEPFRGVELDRERLLGKGVTDLKMADMLFTDRFGDAIKTANIKKTEYVVSSTLIEEVNDHEPWRAEQMVWTIHFPNSNKAMLFKLAYSGGLREIK